MGSFQGNTGRGLEQTGNVGFDSLPDQLVNKAVKKGFDFNILCIGEQLTLCLNIMCTVLVYMLRARVNYMYIYIGRSTVTSHLKVTDYTCTCTTIKLIEHYFVVCTVHVHVLLSTPCTFKMNFFTLKFHVYVYFSITIVFMLLSLSNVVKTFILNDIKCTRVLLLVSYDSLVLLHILCVCVCDGIKCIEYSTTVTTHEWEGCVIIRSELEGWGWNYGVSNVNFNN